MREEHNACPVDDHDLAIDDPSLLPRLPSRIANGRAADAVELEPRSLVYVPHHHGRAHPRRCSCEVRLRRWACTLPRPQRSFARLAEARALAAARIRQRQAVIIVTAAPAVRPRHPRQRETPPEDAMRTILVRLPAASASQRLDPARAKAHATRRALALQ